MNSSFKNKHKLDIIEFKEIRWFRMKAEHKYFCGCLEGLLIIVN